jgi:hypothetical protein
VILLDFNVSSPVAPRRLGLLIVLGLFLAYSPGEPRALADAADAGDVVASVGDAAQDRALAADHELLPSVEAGGTASAPPPSGEGFGPALAAPSATALAAPSASPASSAAQLGETSEQSAAPEPPRSGDGGLSDGGDLAASAEEAPEGVVRLHELRVMVIRRPAGALSPEARARAVSQALERLVDEKELPELRFEERGDLAIVFGGSTPIVQLRPEDAEAAGDASLAIHAASVTSRVRDALRNERQRKSLAESVFSFSLLVFSGLIAVLLLRKVKELTDKTGAWIEENPHRLPALRFQSIDLLRPAAFRGALSVSLSIGRLLSQLGIAYGWLLFASSLFASTRGYTERLSGFVITPISALIGRVGSALPLLLIGLAALLATVLLVRFVGLFFGSVARGETAIGWLPTDLAAPTGTLVRLGIVIAALLLAAPLITGSDNGALARIGLAALVAVGFASSPILASAAVGVAAVYARRVRVGDHAELGGRSGRVVSISLLEVRLEDEMGCQVRVPHLASLLYPTRLLGASTVSSVDVVIDPQAPQGHVRGVLMSVARRFGTICKVDLVRLDRHGAHYHIATRGPSSAAGADLATAIADAILLEQIALGGEPSERS